MDAVESVMEKRHKTSPWPGSPRTFWAIAAKHDQAAKRTSSTSLDDKSDWAKEQQETGSVRGEVDRRAFQAPTSSRSRREHSACCINYGSNERRCSTRL